MKLRAPRAPEVAEPVAGLTPNPRRGGSDLVRLDFCPRAGTCIVIAQIKNWPALDCAECPVYLELGDYINKRSKEVLLLTTARANWSGRQK